MTAKRVRQGRRGSLLRTFLCAISLLLQSRLLLVACAGPSSALRPDVPRDPDAGRQARRSVPPARSGPASKGQERAFANNVHLALGIPTDDDISDDRLLDERSFVVSYNPIRRVPNWAAWRLDRSYLGHVQRTRAFRPDPALPADLYRVDASDYRHSGYDRGHLCPSADREDSSDDNATTFVFTNTQPQLHELNAGPWERLEQYERLRAERGELLYIVAGGVFSNPFSTIGHGVAVPAANFKIVVILRAEQKPADVDARTEVLAVLMPNEPGVGLHRWTEYLTSVDAIESASGYDFLNAIPEGVQRVIEAHIARP